MSYSFAKKIRRMIRAKYLTLDVFTEVKYGGNQLAIFPDASAIPPVLFQKIARELNLSETVFLFPKETEPYSMRIFTPMVELPTAGHPTIGTAYYLAGEFTRKEGVQKLLLDQKVGRIEVEISFADQKPDMITMHQPLPTFGPLHDELRGELAALLSLHTDELDDLPIQEVSCGNNTLIIPLKSTAALAKAKVRSDIWDRLRDQVNRAMIYVFTKNNVTNGDVQGRMFGPEVGITEDPATGSANGPLISYLAKHNLVTGPIVSLQGYEMGRPSQLYLEASKNKSGDITEVKVGGKCVHTGTGEAFIDAE